MKRFLAILSFALLCLFDLAAAQASAAVTPLSVYGQMPGFERAAISPSGDLVAIIGTIGDQRRLVVTGKNAEAIFTLPLGQVKIRDLFWAGDDRVIIYKSDTVALGLGFTADKAELYSAIVVPLGQGQKIWSVFQGKSAVTGGVRGFYGVRQRGGKWYGYFSAITLEGGGKTERYLVSTKPALFEVDLDTGSSRMIGLHAEDDVFRSWLINSSGGIGATLDFVSNSGSWTIENGAGHKIATGRSRFGGIDLVGLGSKGTTLIYGTTDDESGASHWIEVPLDGGASSEILGNVEIERSFFDQHTGQFLGYSPAGDAPEYHFFDQRQQKIANATLKAFPGSVVTLADWNDGFNKLIAVTDGRDDPQTWWLVDIKSGDARPIGQSYVVPAAEVGPVKMIRYKASDGTEIAGVLTLPAGREAKGLPVLLFPHGGPAAHDTVGFDWWAQAFAARGYAVLQPNFRGSTGYGAAFRHAGNGEWGLKMQTDISDGLAFLVQQGIADPKRACIMGASYGGYAALAGVTLQQGLYRCAVAVAGVSDVAKMVATDRDESGGDRTLIRSLAQEVGSGRNLAAISPIRFVDRVTAPVLLVHGKDDTVVRYDQSKDMAAALRRQGKTVEFVTLRSEDHWLSRSETRLAMLQAAAAFVEKYNPADPVASPASTGAASGQSK
ncbi:alpha/beta hydrolase family protein [Sphingomonas immobilis]|uniref:S9 family peptidase n=1 Tax=Sphingomonas immobilis TaxID=3063997 RepID=A0ABT9A3A1_9SPHN|nr:S9 family peptidase [Sphingomonas sp. CA1-15]MDO7843814.1 S9 family peptidase [Sphingomonas sp. CA1-15]